LTGVFILGGFQTVQFWVVEGTCIHIADLQIQHETFSAEAEGNNSMGSGDLLSEDQHDSEGVKATENMTIASGNHFSLNSERRKLEDFVIDIEMAEPGGQSLDAGFYQSMMRQ
jgi:hypothetical protein